MIWTIQSGFLVIYIYWWWILAYMKTIYAANGYIAEHGAVGYLGLKKN
jgi:hypothetical protein